MKLFFLLVAMLTLTGCLFGKSNEVQRAEKIFQHFECSNIETNQLASSSISSFHQQSLAVNKEKASSYIEQYKNGEDLFDIPLDEVVQQKYQLYKQACQALGGISSVKQTIRIDDAE
ncbi:hypothetical protein [Acinetobacter haemolyticus]|uniref:Lipoprotein n=1 Tax=Acinetobacter haemolyticus TaxID=29430 RepID=A0A4P7B590_ACIHA|nr:hypothetical protein [Acinetobacter haemolyticus]ENW19026.1 hypothetical protein F926_02584 [Acinetobacter haemolyticus NIPH 261]MBO3657744.1 hypothetical protein [Acinetobacter haemolyticus]NAR65745.1 hypothetical protein [Acinetobacter haemolyticus]NAR81870.1 hypothetical protein [Acinetobacter haemolyticus]QBQ16695.1 hypothetical protein AHTJR_10565 [Acinetobacter haemolyticus]